MTLPEVVVSGEMTPAIRDREIEQAVQVAANEITDGVALLRAAEALVTVRGHRTDSEEILSPATKAAYQEWKELKAREKKVVDPLVEIEDKLRARIAAWQEQEQEHDATDQLLATLVDHHEITYASQWRGEVTDKMRLIRAVSDGFIGDEYLQVDTKVLNAKAKDLHEDLGELVPGTVATRRIVVGVRKESKTK